MKSEQVLTARKQWALIIGILTITVLSVVTAVVVLGAPPAKTPHHSTNTVIQDRAYAEAMHHNLDVDLAQAKITLTDAGALTGKSVTKLARAIHECTPVLAHGPAKSYKQCSDRLVVAAGAVQVAAQAANQR